MSRHAAASPSPPPLSTALFDFMSGDFDFPHASNSPPPASRGTTVPPIEDYLALDRRERERERERNRVNPAADNDEHVTTQSRRTRVNRQLRRPHVGGREHRDSSSLSRPPPPTSSNNRPRARISERYLRRSHARLREQRAAASDSTVDPLDSLADVPIPNPFTAASATTRPRSPHPDTDSSRRTKRRKLGHESNRAASQYDGFKYGYKGQVVPGRLKMEIASCDGGEYKSYEGNHAIHNVLRNDTSVYCSDRPQCNLLLKHIGETPFNLEKVVIRTPHRGFTAPVQEGLIFVAMSSSGLLSGTSGYQIEYGDSSPRDSPAPSSQDDQQLSFREALDDAYIWQHSHQGIQEAMEDQIQRLRLRGRLGPHEPSARDLGERHREERRPIGFGYEYMDPFEICEDPDNDTESSPIAGISAPTPPPFTITAESEEDESDTPQEQPSAAIMADRLRRESRWREPSSDEDDDIFAHFPPPRRSYALGDTSDVVYGGWRPSAQRSYSYIEPLRANRLRAPSRIEPKESPQDMGTLIAPHARFFIAKHKNKITIKFHPAVSGKYVLLKLWSPTHDGNIDIESVQFYGYSGPRFFPASKPC